MAQVDRLEAIVGADATEFFASMRKVSSSAKRTTAEVARRFNAMGDSMIRVGTRLTATVTAAFALVGGSAIKMGMDAIESENLFRVSFKGMSKEARAWSVEMSERLGANQFELRKTSAMIFTMVRSMGLAKDAAFEMATGMTELANDLASFFNLPVEEAFAKLRSGIVGESEPLRRLGILIDENTIKQVAYNEGLVESGEELTQIQKVQARWLAILQQTTDAQGDLARTIDDPTNRLRVMRARMEETTIELGMALMPVFERFLDLLQTKVVPAIEGLVDRFKNLTNEQQGTVLAWAGAAAAAGPLLIVVGSLTKMMGSLIGVTGNIIAFFTSWPGLIIGSTIAIVAFNRTIGTAFSVTLKGLKNWFGEWKDFLVVKFNNQIVIPFLERIKRLVEGMNKMGFDFISPDDIEIPAKKAFERAEEAQDTFINGFKKIGIVAKEDFEDLKTIIATLTQEAKDLVKDLLPEGLVHLLFGDPEKAGKEVKMEMEKVIEEAAANLEPQFGKGGPVDLSGIPNIIPQFENLGIKSQPVDIEPQFGGVSTGINVDQLQNELEMLQTHLADKEELERISHAKRLEQLNQLHENMMVGTREFLELTKDLEKKHSQNILDIKEDEAEEKKRMQQNVQRNLFAGIQSFATNMGRINEDMFKAAQVIGAATALVSTYVAGAITLEKASAVGLFGPAAVAMALSVIGAGLGFVSTIKGVTKGGGGGGGGGTAVAGQAAQPTTNVGGGQAGPTTIVNLKGESFSRNQVQDLLEQLNEDLSDGGRLLVAR